MKFFVDTADIEAIRELNDLGLLDGVTTNPSLIAKSGRDIQEVLEEIWNDNPLLRQYLGSIENPELIVYRVVPSRVRFMREWALQYHDVPLEN